MNARRTPERAPMWRSIGLGYGEPAAGKVAGFRVALPKEYAAPPDDLDGKRYAATGRLRWLTVDPPKVAILSVTVTDSDTGAHVTARGDRVTLTAQAGATPEYVSRLWADARVIFGHVRRRLGRAPGTTVTDAEIRRAIAALKREYRKITEDAIAGQAGTFTKYNLRYYLRVNGKQLRDYL